MKSLVELAPFSSGDPPIVYTGDKKTTLITLDAATGKVLKWFGSSGSHVNEAERCLRPDTLHGMDSTLECSSTGTVTLGRTEYTVGIQRPDGRPIATLKYAEWGPNNFDHDLYGQYYNSLDSRYITTRHDGKVYGFDYNRAEGASPIFSHKFAEPVAKVFDVCRPRDAPPDSNPELIILPQPPLPSSDKEGARVRSNRVFLNQTGSDGWYALSGLAYPLITDAPTALLAMPEWLDLAPPLENIEEGQLSKALIGNHFLESSSGPNNPPTLPGSPAGAIGDGHKDLENESAIPIHIGDDGGESTIIEKVKLIPKSAAKNVVDFVSNPILIILFIVGLVYNEKKLRRAYRAYRERGFSQEHDLWHALGFTGDVGEGDSVDMGKGDFRPTPKGTSGRAAKREVVATASAISQAGDQLEPAATEATPAETAPNEALTVSVEVDAKTVNDSKASSDSVESPGDASAVSAQNSSVPEKKKGKSHRGQRGGVKHRKKRARDSSKSPEENATDTVDEAVSTAKRLGGEPAALEPDVMTVTNDMQAIGGPIIRMGNIEVNTELQLGTGSNGTLVFAGKFDGRDVAVKRMLIHFYDIASQETRLLRESDDHPNGKMKISQRSATFTDCHSHPLLFPADSRRIPLHRSGTLCRVAGRCC
jgi:serine/threonine-protein kinase/endoribonuclease IRE1